MINKTYVFGFALILLGGLVIVNAEEMQEPTYGPTLPTKPGSDPKIQLNKFELPSFWLAGENFSDLLCYTEPFRPLPPRF